MVKKRSQVVHAGMLRAMIGLEANSEAASAITAAVKGT